MPTAEIARRLDRDPGTVRREVQSVIASDFVRFRCDTATEQVGWPVTSVWLARAQPGQVHATMSMLRTMSELRLGLLVTGTSNVLFSALHRNLRGVSEMNHRLGRMLPGLEVTGSYVLLRSRKRWGWLLGDDGRRTGEYIRPSVFSAEFLDT